MSIERKNMKIGNKTSAFFKTGDSQRGFMKMKEFGFECADYQELLNPKGDIYSMSENEFETFLKCEKNNADAAKIYISQVHGPWIVDDTTEEARKVGRHYYERSIRGTALLDCKYVVFHPFMPFGRADVENEIENWEMNIEFFQSLAPLAKATGVTICIENMPFRSLSIAGWRKIGELVDELNDDCFGICIDTGHCNILGDSAAEALDTLGNRVKVLHVHDNMGRFDQHLIPFTGRTDWVSFAKALGRTKLVLSLEPGDIYEFPAELGKASDLMLRTEYMAAQRLLELSAE